MQGDNLKSAQEISKKIWQVQGKILFDFFEELKSKFGHVSVLGLNEYDREKCNKWFNSTEKLNDIGFCFDVGSSKIVFRIEAAMYALHYGIVPVKKNDNDEKYEFISNSKILISPFDEFRKGRKWASKIHLVANSYSVFHDANLIRGENEQKFMEELESSIDILRIETARMEALEQGRAEGLELGKQAGIEQGLERGKIEVAQKLLASMNDTQIADVTGLAVQTVTQLRNH